MKMAIVPTEQITLLNHVKPFKTTWKVEVKVLHLWTQHSNGDSLQFILADKTVSVSICYGLMFHKCYIANF